MGQEVIEREFAIRSSRVENYLEGLKGKGELDCYAVKPVVDAEKTERETTIRIKRGCELTQTYGGALSYIFQQSANACIVRYESNGRNYLLSKIEDRNLRLKIQRLVVKPEDVPATPITVSPEGRIVHGFTVKIPNTNDSSNFGDPRFTDAEMQLFDDPSCVRIMNPEDELFNEILKLEASSASD